MNRTDLVAVVSKETNLSPSQVDNVVESFINNIFNALGQNDNVTISKFGSFSCVQRKDREGHNPKSGEKILIPSKKAVKFRPAKAFREVVASLPLEPK